MLACSYCHLTLDMSVEHTLILLQFVAEEIIFEDVKYHLKYEDLCSMDLRYIY